MVNKNWIVPLKEELTKNINLNHIDFLNEYYHIIDGSNRDSKRKKVKRAVEKIKEEMQNNQENKKENVYENIYNPTIIDLNIKRKTISFGLISDTHFNSKYSQITHLNKFYDECQRLGITTIYHAGDIDDGENMRPGHVYENYTQGADEHLNEIIKNYPKRDNITTYFITGNHDASFKKHCGLNIGKHIENNRSDLVCLGQDFAIVNITPEISLMLRHPWDGTSYALSYKIQKMVESMDENTRPTIMAVGHYHKLEYLYYLGVHCLQSGCFQSSTPFTVGKGIRVSMGGWIITLEIDENTRKMISLTPKAITFNTPIKEDYKDYNRY